MLDMSGILGMVGSGLGGSAGGDDPYANIRARLQAKREAEQAAQKQQQGQEAGSAAGRASRQAGLGALDMARQSPGYSYEYDSAMRAVGMPAGRQYGVMAQDLERTPAGRSVVRTDPGTGSKFVDTRGLTMQNTAAIGQMQRERDDETRERQSQRSSERKAYRDVQRRKREADYRTAQENLRARMDSLRNMTGYRW